MRAEHVQAALLWVVEKFLCVPRLEFELCFSFCCLQWIIIIII